MTLVLALLAGWALIVGGIERRAGRRASGWLWFVWGVVLGILAAASALDVAQRIGRRARDRLQTDDWYQDRRRLQAAGAVLLVAVGVVVTLWVVRVVIRTRPTNLVISLAVLALVGFVAVRSVSLHQIDALLYRRHLGSAEVNTWFELVLAALVGLGCLVGSVSAWVDARRGRGSPWPR